MYKPTPEETHTPAGYVELWDRREEKRVRSQPKRILMKDGVVQDSLQTRR